jgi:PLP dependent protein
MEGIATRLAQIRLRVANRAQIIGVTKGQTAGAIQMALDAGLTDLGNNYVQEGSKLRKSVGTAKWHFIGTIQSRKAKLLVDYDLVHSVDRLEILEDWEKRIPPERNPLEFLVEVNLGAEQSKSGILPEALESFIHSFAHLRRVRCRGLMVLPPPLHPVELRRPFFQRAKALLDTHSNLGWDTLSMGTSEDFEVALEEGATMIRLGTVLFGPRT